MEDMAVVSAILVAEGLIEEFIIDGEGGARVTDKGYEKGYNLWMSMSGEDRMLIALFLRRIGTV